MSKFKIIPLSTAYANRIRSTMQDEYGHLLFRQHITGRALCRHCLSDGNKEQQQILFSYMPFEKSLTPYAEVGPVFIHEDCQQYHDTSVFPPDLLTRKYLMVRGYSNEQRLIAGDLSEGHAVEKSIDQLFTNPAIDFIHINDGKTGCYFLRVERVE